LVPAPEAEAADATVWFSVPPDPELRDAQLTWEALNASTLTDGTFVVRGCSALFAGVAYGDTVRAVSSAEGAHVVTGILDRGGFDSARVWFENGGNSWRAPVEALATAGAVVDVYSENLAGLSWPCSIDLHATLERMESRGLLIYATA
jgi:hypothetical protein